MREQFKFHSKDFDMMPFNETGPLKNIGSFKNVKYEDLLPF
jgi:hypothetical protein